MPLKKTVKTFMGLFSMAPQRTSPYIRRSFGFRISRAANQFLDPSLKEKVEWVIPETTPKPPGTLFEIWSKIPGAHKWRHYFPIYEKIFGPLKQMPIRILEIGVYKCASIKMWQKFFHEDSIIVGIDSNEQCLEFEDRGRNLHIRIGEQQNREFLRSVIDDFGKFDVIIDDGSHITSHMIASFNFLFCEGLKEKGIYFVEDTHTNFWPSHRDTKVSFVDFSKHLVDLMHYHYTIGTNELAFRLGADARIRSFQVFKVTRLIEEIRFFDSIVVIYSNPNLTVPVSQHL